MVQIQPAQPRASFHGLKFHGPVTQSGRVPLLHSGSRRFKSMPGLPTQEDNIFRVVAQAGSASALGAEGRVFESHLSDHRVLAQPGQSIAFGKQGPEVQILHTRPFCAVVSSEDERCIVNAEAEVRVLTAVPLSPLRPTVGPALDRRKMLVQFQQGQPFGVRSSRGPRPFAHNEENAGSNPARTTNRRHSSMADQRTVDARTGVRFSLASPLLRRKRN